MISLTNVPTPIFPTGIAETIEQFALDVLNADTAGVRLAEFQKKPIWKKTQKAVVKLIFSQLQGSFYFTPAEEAEDMMIHLWRFGQAVPAPSEIAPYLMREALNLAVNIYEAHKNVSRSHDAKRYTIALRHAQSMMDLYGNTPYWDEDADMGAVSKVVEMTEAATVRTRRTSPDYKVLQFADGSLFDMTTQVFYQNEKALNRVGFALVDETPDATPSNVVAMPTKSKPNDNTEYDNTLPTPVFEGDDPDQVPCMTYTDIDHMQRWLTSWCRLDSSAGLMADAARSAIAGLIMYINEPAESTA
jgi:hypothetical protein